jgi:chorismate mutase
MATLKQSLEWAKLNPEDPKTGELIKRLQSGSFDDQARKEGLDLSSVSSTYKTSQTPTQGMNLFQQAQEAVNKPAFTGEQIEQSGVGGGFLKSLANVGKSLVKNVAGIVASPFTGAVNIAKLPGEALGLSQDIANAKQASQKAQQMALQVKQKTGVASKAGTKQEPVATASSILSNIKTGAKETLLSEAIQKLTGGDVQGAVKSIAEDPYQVLPYLLGVKQAVGKAPKAGTLAGNIETAVKAPTEALKYASGVTKEIGGLTKKAVTSEPVKSFVSKGTPLEGILSPTPEIKLARLDQAIKTGIDKGVKIRDIAARKTVAGREKFYQDANIAVKSIAERRNNIQILDEKGNPTGKAPQSNYEAAQAIGQAKEQIWKDVEAISKEAKEMGIRVSTDPVIKFLDDYTKDISHSPEARAYAKSQIAKVKELNGADPVTIEARIKELNNELTGYYGKTVKPVNAQIDASIAYHLRQLQEASLENAPDGLYGSLKKQFGSLKALEPEVNHRATVQARQAGAKIYDFTDVFTGGEIASGIITGNIATITRGTAGMIIKSIYKKINNPDRYISSMFKQAYDTIPLTTETAIPQPPTSISSQMPKTMGMIERLKNVKPGLTIEDVSKTQPQVFSGLKDLSTKLVEKLKGRTTVSKQFISDLTNSPDLKQQEKDIVRNILDAQKGDTIPVADFAKKVQAELLPLKLKVLKGGQGIGNSPFSEIAKYENYTLPEEARGNVANYTEHIWESPIKTSAGDVHFPGVTNKYAGHTRIEDMARDTVGKDILGITDFKANQAGDTRRVIEVQSDLYQKGNLEGEIPRPSSAIATEIKMYEDATKQGKTLSPQQKRYYDNAKLDLKEAVKREKDLTKLQQYNDPTAHFRMVREEIKQAAKDGKTKLQFPTGETAMKIEGLGEQNPWLIGKPGEFDLLKPEQLKVGQEVEQSAYRQVTQTGGQTWVITDVLGNGKFKAVPKQNYEQAKAIKQWGKDSYGFNSEKQYLDNKSEQFDISGRVDSNNPIYKFYEKDLGKYLKNRHGAQLVTDKQGVTWWEVAITKEMGKLPVEAFGIIAMPFLQGLQQQQEQK